MQVNMVARMRCVASCWPRDCAASERSTRMNLGLASIVIAALLDYRVPCAACSVRAEVGDVSASCRRHRRSCPHKTGHSGKTRKVDHIFGLLVAAHRTL